MTEGKSECWTCGIEPVTIDGHNLNRKGVKP
jgi:hypothetical protein